MITQSAIKFILNRENKISFLKKKKTHQIKMMLQTSKYAPPSSGFDFFHACTQ